LTETGLVVREYRDGDEGQVLTLLDRSFGGWPEVEGAVPPDAVAFFRWKHGLSPFGRSRMAVAERDGEIAGFRAFMPWLLRGAGRTVRAARTADAATVPDLQRTGVFGNIRRAAEGLFGEPVDLYFGTPNELSLGATAKLGGRSVAGTLPAFTRVRPWGLWEARRRRGVVVPNAEPAGGVLADSARVDELLDQARGGEDRLATAKDAAWLRWRYGEAPLDYRAVAYESGGRLRGLAIFRIRARRGWPEAVIEELFVLPGERRTASRLLREAERAAPVALSSCCFPPRTPQRRAALLRGFLRWRGGSMIVVKDTGPSVSPPPSEIDSWALTLGDLELV
jgi:hypothetical protein